jgi:alpha-ribazole phosphatase
VTVIAGLPLAAEGPVAVTRFWLVRHGPTHAKTMVGWTDLPADLSDTAALSRLSAHLPQAPVISSDLSRAMATADALGPRPRLPHDPALRELHFGQWETRPFAEIEAETPDLIRAFWDTPGDVARPRRRKLERPCQPHLGRA